jgi:carbon-monoxide dehydrogenase medium subunit
MAYADPGTLDEACALLAQSGDEAKVLAGGQSLLVMLRQRLLAPDLLIDIKRIPELQTVDRTDHGSRVGATVTYGRLRTLTQNVSVPSLLVQAVGAVGSIHIRNRGTFGGSLAHADPAGDAPVALLALGGTIEMRSTRGPRTEMAERFFTGLFRTTLEPDELVTGVVVPDPAPETSHGYRRYALREGEFPLAQAAVMLRWEGHHVAAARVAVGGAAERPLLIPDVEAALVGRTRDTLWDRDVERRARTAIHPFPDVRGSTDWKRDVVIALIRRSVSDAGDARMSGQAGQVS